MYSRKHEIRGLPGILEREKNKCYSMSKKKKDLHQRSWDDLGHIQKHERLVKKEKMDCVKLPNKEF